MRPSVTRGSILLAVLFGLPTSGAFAAVAAIICHPDPPGTKTAKVAGAVMDYRMRGAGVSIVYRGLHGCRRTHWSIGGSLSPAKHAPKAACAERAIRQGTPTGGTGRVAVVHGSADLPTRVRIVSATGVVRSWPLPEHVQRFDAFGQTAVFAGAEREVYAVNLANGRVALVGLDRKGDVPQIDAPGVVFQDNLAKKYERSGRTLMKFIPAAAVQNALWNAGKPVDLPGPVEAIGMDGFRVALAFHRPGDCSQILYWNIAWDYLSKISDEDETTCELTEAGGSIRSVSIAGIRSAWTIHSRRADRILTSNSTRCFDRVVSTVRRKRGGVTGLSGDGASLVYAVRNDEGRGNAVGIVRGRDTRTLVHDGAPMAVSADAGRIAVLNRTGTIDLRSAKGELIATIRDTDAAAVALRANHVVVLTRSGSLDVFRTATQEKLHSWPAPSGLASRVDAQFGVAVVTAGGNVYAISLTTGRQALVASVPGSAMAEIEPSGIVYAYNTGSRGHLRFIRFAEVEAALR